MIYKTCQHPFGCCKVIAHLGAAEGVGEGVKSCYRALHKVLIVPDHLFSYGVYAAYRRYDPDVVSHRGAPVLTDKALEGPVICLDIGIGLVIIGIITFLREIRFGIVGMYPFSGLDILFCACDGEAVFDDVLAGFDIKERNLVTSLYIIKRSDINTGYGKAFAFLYVIKCNSYIIIFIYPKKFHFRPLSFVKR